MRTTIATLILFGMSACGEPLQESAPQESAWSFQEESDLMTDHLTRTAISRSIAGNRAELSFSCQWVEADPEILPDWKSRYAFDSKITWPEDMHRNQWEWDLDGMTVIYRLGNSEPLEMDESLLFA